MKYLSVFSGIDAASVAWEPLGWKPVGFSEIEAFPCAVLAQRFPSVPNFGDVTKYHTWDIKPGSFDVLIGGSPCQAFSVAGLRKGLEDPRGNLALVFLGLVDHFMPRWVIWENVPGTLSDKTNVIGNMLDAFAELGYMLDIDILDARYFGVPQRRRRVFIVAQRIDSILSQDTTASALVVSQFLAEILGTFLTGLPRPFETFPVGSKLSEEVQDRLQRRLKLFKVLDSGDVPGNPGVDLESIRQALASSSIEEFSDEKVFPYFESVLKVAKNVLALDPKCPRWSGAAGAVLTTLEGYLSYARQTGDGIFGGVSWDGGWIDAVGQAEYLSEAIQHIGDWGYPPAVFSESESGDGDTPESGSTGEGSAPCSPASPGTSIQDLAPTVTASGPPYSRTGQASVECEALVYGIRTAPTGANGWGITSEETSTLDASSPPAIACRDTAAPLRASTTGTGRIGDQTGQDNVIACLASGQANAEITDGGHSPSMTCLHEVPIITTQEKTYGFQPGITGREGNPSRFSEGIAPTLTAEAGDNQAAVLCTEVADTLTCHNLINPQTAGYNPGIVNPIFVPDAAIKTTDHQGDRVVKEGGVFPTPPASGANNGGGAGALLHETTKAAVRRLLPIECERLQGFPDSWTKIVWHDSPAEDCPDGPRYKAIGNSMAVPVIRWLGQRIELVENSK